MQDVVIIVVARDRLSMFPRCLEAVDANTPAPYRLIVVAGGADRRTREYLQQLRARRDNLSVVLVERLLLAGEARNIALRQCSERFCVILENDAIVRARWLPPLLECMQEERAAVVTPMVWWYRGLHTAGCVFEEHETNGTIEFSHTIQYTDIRRKRIDYPENHCILIDRRLVPGDEVFDDVEPFDVDLGLWLRTRGLSVYFEPRSEITYAAPPPLEVRDIPYFMFRWDAVSWEERNRRFMQKWRVAYDPAAKLASYRRQQLKLGIARWYPTALTVGISNLVFGALNRFQSLMTHGRTSYRAGGSR